MQQYIPSIAHATTMNNNIKYARSNKEIYLFVILIHLLCMNENKQRISETVYNYTHSKSHHILQKKKKTRCKMSII